MMRVFVSIRSLLGRYLRYLTGITNRLFYYGKSRYCPVCEKKSRQFMPFGIVKRLDAQCSYCGALERHRLLWLYLQKRTNIFDGQPRKILHVAPEKVFELKFLQYFGLGYLTADLKNINAMVRMDITSVPCRDESFDVIYCSHVLEHVPNDRKALDEFFRVLKNDGWAILLVPIEGETTHEDPSIVAPVDRLHAYGNPDHVRSYGRDYVQRLQDAGFHVTVTTVSDLADPGTAYTMGLTAASGEIFFCSKQQMRIP